MIALIFLFMFQSHYVYQSSSVDTVSIRIDDSALTATDTIAFMTGQMQVVRLNPKVRTVVTVTEEKWYEKRSTHFIVIVGFVVICLFSWVYWKESKWIDELPEYRKDLAEINDKMSLTEYERQ